MVARFLPLEPGDPRSVADFELRALIGRGGMGRVYLSFTPGGRAVAVKVIRPELAADPEFRERFRREIAAARRVDSLYTAPVVGADAEAERPWLATAYVPGPSLHEVVVESGPLSADLVLRLFGAVAEGVAAVHSAGLVHRDLKPGNVLLAADGPRVIDFGVAYEPTAGQLTTVGSVLGTPVFLAPEQVTGDPVGPATDIFALGHLTAFVAMGRAAYTAATAITVQYRIAAKDPDLADCPQPLRGIVELCMARDPADRPALAEVIDQVRRLRGPDSPDWFLPGPLRASLGDYDTARAGAAKAGLSAPSPAPVQAPVWPPAIPSVPVGEAGRSQPGQPIPGPHASWQTGPRDATPTGWDPTYGARATPGAPTTPPQAPYPSWTGWPPAPVPPQPSKQRRKRPVALTVSISLALTVTLAVTAEMKFGKPSTSGTSAQPLSGVTSQVETGGVPGAGVLAVTPTPAPGPLSVTGAWTKTLQTLVLTVTKVENDDGMVTLYVKATSTDQNSITLPLFGNFTAIDNQGVTYQAQSFASNWNETVPGNDTISGTILLEQQVSAAATSLKISFANVLGSGFDFFDGSITVSSVPVPH
ncbi:MAG TPA: protein kinase [Actinocrinis sp.]|nr:protein kinase [Actinocrinis sp.]